MSLIHSVTSKAGAHLSEVTKTPRSKHTIQGLVQHTNKPQYGRFGGPSYKVFEATRVHSSNNLIEGKNMRAAEEPLARFHHDEFDGGS